MTDLPKIGPGYLLAEKINDKNTHSFKLVIREINKTLCVIMGGTESDLVGKSLDDIWPEKDNPLTSSADMISSGSRRTTFHSFAASGKTYRIEITGLAANLIAAFFMEASHEEQLQDTRFETLCIPEKLSRIVFDYIFRLSPMEGGLMNMEIITGDYSMRTGRKINEAKSQADWSRIIHPDDIGLLDSKLDHIISTKEPVTFECRSFTADDSLRWIEVSAVPQYDNGNLVIFGSVRDISHKKKEAEILVAANREIQWRNTDLQIMNAINQAANENMDPDYILAMVSEQISQAFNSHLITIHLPDPERRELVMHASRQDKFMTDRIRKLIGRKIPDISFPLDGPHPFMNIKETRKGILYTGDNEIADRLEAYLEGTSWSQKIKSFVKILIPALQKLLDYKSQAAVPMITNDEITGYIEVGSQDLLSANDLARIQAIADQFASVFLRHASENRLRESEEKFRRLFETMAQGVVYQVKTGEIVLANPAAEKILGLTIGQMQGRTSIDPVWKAIHEDGSDFPGDTHPAMITLATGRESSAVMGVYNPGQDSYRWIHVNAIPEFRNNEPLPFQVFTTFEDITDLKNTLDELNRSKELLEQKVKERTIELTEINNFQKAILDNSPFAIFVTDMAGVIRSVNPAGETITGYSIDEITGMTPLQFHDMEEALRFCSEITGKSNSDPEEVFLTMLDFMLNNTTEWHWIRKNGDKIPVKISLKTIITQDGDSNGFLGIIQDITKEKLFLESLRASEERFQSMFREHSAVMLLTDPENGVILQANKTARKYYGLDFSGSRINLQEINIPVSGQSAAGTEKTSGTRHQYFIAKHKLASGEIRAVEVHSTPIEVNGKKTLFSIIHDVTERESALKALKKSEAENRAIVLAIPDLLFKLNREGVYLDLLSNLNPSLYTEPVNFLGKTILEILPQEVALPSMEALSRAFTKLEVVQYNYSLKIKSDLRYFENRIIAISDNEALAIIRDITDRQRAIQEMEETMQKLNILIRNMQSGTIFETPDRRISLVNQNFCDLFGIMASPDMLTGTSCAESARYSMSLMTDEEHFIRRIDELTKDKEPAINEELYLKDGRAFERDYIPIFLIDRFLGHLWQYRDITHRKEFEKAIRQKNQELETFFSVVPDLLCIASLNGKFIKVNNSWSDILGFSVSELEQMKLLDFVHPEDINTTLNAFKILRFKNVINGFTNRYRNKDGQYRYIEWKGILMGGLIYASARDITEWQNYESSLKETIARERELSDLKTRFVSMVSHEFRTPLASIQAATDSLSGYWDRLSELQRNQKLHKISDQVNRLSGYIRDMLHLSKLQMQELPLERKSYNVVALVGQVVDEHRIISGNSERIIYTSANDIPDIELYYDEFVSIIDNLLSNGLKYSDEEKIVRIALSKDENDLIITVSDEGIGISQEDAPRLFEPFFRAVNSTGIPGSGLGLPIVREAVEKHGGTIEIDSRVSKGTQVIVRIPLK